MKYRVQCPVQKVAANRKLSGLLLAAFLASATPSWAVNTLSHAETLTSNGAITLSSSAVPSAGGITLGYFSGSSAPLDSVIQSWSAANAIANLISSSWVDVRTVNASGAGMQSNGDWDWPGGGSPGTAGTKIGGTYNWVFDASLANKQLYIFAFNAGTSGFGFSSSSVVAPSASAFTASSFAGSTEWAALKAVNWIFPATDGTALNLKVVDIDVASELLVGTDGGNNIAMIPEPSSVSLLLIGLGALWTARRKVSEVTN